MAQPRVWSNGDKLWYDGREAICIGAGTNGTVWQVHKTLRGRIYTRVVKVVDPQLGRKEYELVRWFAEGPPFHENIIQLYGYIYNPPLFCFEYEFIETDLHRATSEIWRRGWELSDPTIASIALKILYGLQYMHEKGFVHGDLKQNNVLVSRDFSIVKLADFGATCKVKPLARLKMPGIHTTYFYAAPEVFGLVMTYKSDIFSFAVICYNLWSGTKDGIQFPFYPGDWKYYDQQCHDIAESKACAYTKKYKIKDKVFKENLSNSYYLQVLATALQKEPFYPNNAKSLLNKENAAFEFLKKCLKPKYEERLSVSDAIQYGFLQSVISRQPQGRHQYYSRHSQPQYQEHPPSSVYVQQQSQHGYVNQLEPQQSQQNQVSYPPQQTSARSQRMYPTSRQKYQH